MTEPRHSLERTIREIEKCVRCHTRIYEREGGKTWHAVLAANQSVLEMLEQPDPDPTAIRRFIEEQDADFGGSAWYEVRMMIWLWEGADRGERP